MANLEHLAMLKKNVRTWNEWRRAENINSVDLTGAVLCGEKLRDADLRFATLCGANLSKAFMPSVDISGANLCNANLTGAALSHANVGGANLIGANLTGVILGHANLRNTQLSGADLTDAKLVAAALYGTQLANANLTRATMGHTLIGNTDLRRVKGLDSVLHVAPSTIGLDTVYSSNGEIPEAFLRGAGVPDALIELVNSLNKNPIEFYSCFISYSTADEEFASRLHNDFQAGGIRCWKWDHDARTGRSLWGEIDQAIRVYDKLVLIASESSLKSPAVNREIERALVQEDERLKRKLAGDVTADGDVLFPVRIDDFLFKSWEHERKVDVTKKVIADARGWGTDPAVYKKVLAKLIKDLKNEKPALGPGAT